MRTKKTTCQRCTWTAKWKLLCPAASSPSIQAHALSCNRHLVALTQELEAAASKHWPGALHLAVAVSAVTP